MRIGLDSQMCVSTDGDEKKKQRRSKGSGRKVTS